MDLDALHGALGTAMLDHGGPITAAHARMLACDAMIIPAVLGSASQVLDMGTAVRLFPNAHPPGHHPAGPRMHLPRLRPARLLVRLSPCAPLGGRRAHQLGNAVLLCPHHHRLIHRGDWEIRFAADGIPEFLPPPWIDPNRTPRRNTMHHRPFHQRT